MIREILTYPNALLKKDSVPVEKVTSAITDLVNDLFETMHDSPTGIGLAAPQVGENLNILVMDVPKSNSNDEEEKGVNPICLINPKIIKRDGTIIYEEGCLSCPGLLVDVKRSQYIIVSAWDAEGRTIELNLSDLEAVCAQHEMDHLRGKLLTDQISRLKREMYRKQRVKLNKEQGQAETPDKGFKI